MSFWKNVGMILRGEQVLSKGELENTLHKALSSQAEEFKQRMLARPKAEHLPIHNRNPVNPLGDGPAKPIGFSNKFLRQFYRESPMLRAVIDIRKREVSAAKWAIEPDIKKHTEELNFLQRIIRSTRRYQDLIYMVEQFEPMYITRDVASALIEGCSRKPDITDWEIKHRFQLAHDEIFRNAEIAAKPIVDLLENPHPIMDWSDILASMVPDLLVLDSGCIEAIRKSEPPDIERYNMTGVKLPHPANTIGRLVPVDGGTIRPVINEHGMPADLDDHSMYAYEQWIENQKVGDFRHCDLIRIIENPQTDVAFRGNGFSRTETLIITCTLDLLSDKAEMEEKKRAMYGGFLNIKDESFQPEDMQALRTDIAQQLEGTKKLPIVSFEDMQYVSVRGERNFGEVSKEKRDLYLSRLCATFEIGKTKLGIYDNANRSTAESSTDLTDDGLKHLLQVIDRNITKWIVKTFGCNDLKYVSNPAHGRDEKEKRETLNEELESCLISVNDARIRMGYEPIEGGEESIHYFKKQQEAKGDAEGKASVNVDGPMDDEDGDGINDELEDNLDDGEMFDFDEDENDLNKANIGTNQDDNYWPQLF